MREMLWADIVPPGYFLTEPRVLTYWPEVRDMECNLLGRVRIATSEYPWHARTTYWRFVMRSDVEISYPPKEVQYDVRTVDLKVSEFRVGGRPDKWYGFQTDKSLDELKRIPSFAPQSDARAEQGK